MKTANLTSILFGFAALLALNSTCGAQSTPHGVPQKPELSAPAAEVAKLLRQFEAKEIQLLQRVMVERHRTFNVESVSERTLKLLPKASRETDPTTLQKLTAFQWNSHSGHQYRENSQDQTLLFKQNFMGKPLLLTQVTDYYVPDPPSHIGKRLFGTNIDDFECRVEGSVLFSGTDSFSFVIVSSEKPESKTLDGIYGTQLLCDVAVPLQPRVWYRMNAYAEWLFRFEQDPGEHDQGQVEINFNRYFQTPSKVVAKFKASPDPQKPSWRLVQFEGFPNAKQEGMELTIAPSRTFAEAQPIYRHHRTFAASTFGHRSIQLFNHELDEDVLYTKRFWLPKDIRPSFSGGGWGGFGF